MDLRTTRKGRGASSKHPGDLLAESESEAYSEPCDGSEDENLEDLDENPTEGFTNRKLRYYQKGEPAKNARRGEDVRQLRLKCRPRLILHWLEWMAPFQRERVMAGPFRYYFRIPAFELLVGLIRAVGERYSKITNTFLTCQGEAVISLEDVVRLTGLPVHGDPVMLSSEERKIADQEVHALLGLCPPKHKKSDSISASWLNKHFGPSINYQGKSMGAKIDKIRHPVDMPGEAAEQELRAFYLYFFAQVLFPTGTARIPRFFLSLLKDPTRLDRYSWGAAALAVLHSQLCELWAGSDSMGGFLPLLQFWSMEHFDLARPRLTVEPAIVFPRGIAWAQGSYSRLALKGSPYFARGFFDGLTQQEVTWTPYADCPEDEEFLQLGRALFDVTIWVICLAAVFPVRMDRALRQLGLTQGRPDGPFPHVARRIGGGFASETDYVLIYKAQLESWKSGGIPVRNNVTTQEAEEWNHEYSELFHDQLHFHDIPFRGEADFLIGGETPSAILRREHSSNVWKQKFSKSQTELYITREELTAMKKKCDMQLHTFEEITTLRGQMEFMKAGYEKQICHAQATVALLQDGLKENQSREAHLLCRISQTEAEREHLQRQVIEWQQEIEVLKKENQTLATLVSSTKSDLEQGKDLLICQDETICRLREQLSIKPPVADPTTLQKSLQQVFDTQLERAKREHARILGDANRELDLVKQQRDDATVALGTTRALLTAKGDEQVKSFVDVVQALQNQIEELQERERTRSYSRARSQSSGASVRLSRSRRITGQVNSTLLPNIREQPPQHSPSIASSSTLAPNLPTQALM